MTTDGICDVCKTSLGQVIPVPHRLVLVFDHEMMKSARFRTDKREAMVTLVYVKNILGLAFFRNLLSWNPERHGKKQPFDRYLRHRGLHDPSQAVQSGIPRWVDLVKLFVVSSGFQTTSTRNPRVNKPEKVCDLTL